MFTIQVIDLSKPPLALGCPATTLHEASSLLGARMTAEAIAKERKLPITKWHPFGSDSHTGHAANDQAIACITKG